MILLDKWLTVKRIRSTMKELGNTMAAYKTYEKSVQLASELNAMFENSPNIKRYFQKRGHEISIFYKLFECYW